MDAIFYIAVLVMSVVIHEVAHGYAALYFGDQTARFAGRLTINPLKHLDPFGSIILPALLVLTNSPILLGWAKPVPYNPDNLSNRKWGSFAVAAAGVMANFLIAFIFSLILRFTISLELSSPFYFIIQMIIITNLSLGIFNLVPVPPLDGSKILFTLLPRAFDEVIAFIENYSLILILVFIIFFSNYLVPVMLYLYRLFTGLALG